MFKFHISKSGDPALCTANQRPCPVGGSEAHFDSAEEAALWRLREDLAASEEAFRSRLTDEAMDEMAQHLALEEPPLSPEEEAALAETDDWGWEEVGETGSGRMLAEMVMEGRYEAGTPTSVHWCDSCGDLHGHREPDAAERGFGGRRDPICLSCEDKRIDEFLRHGSA